MFFPSLLYLLPIYLSIYLPTHVFGIYLFGIERTERVGGGATVAPPLVLPLALSETIVTVDGEAGPAGGHKVDPREPVCLCVCHNREGE